MNSNTITPTRVAFEAADATYKAASKEYAGALVRRLPRSEITALSRASSDAHSALVAARTALLSPENLVTERAIEVARQAEIQTAVETAVAAGRIYRAPRPPLVRLRR